MTKLKAMTLKLMRDHTHIRGPAPVRQLAEKHSAPMLVGNQQLFDGLSSEPNRQVQLMV